MISYEALTALRVPAARREPITLARLSIDDGLLHQLYYLAKMESTGANSSPLLLVFVRGTAAKEQLKPMLNADERRQDDASAGDGHRSTRRGVLKAAADVEPGAARVSRPHRRTVGGGVRPLGAAERDAAGDYLIMAARGLRLDYRPMGGVGPAAVDKELFPDEKWKSSLLINLGYGDRDKMFPRQPRLSFDEACRIAQHRETKRGTAGPRAGSVTDSLSDHPRLTPTHALPWADGLHCWLCRSRLLGDNDDLWRPCRGY